MTGEDLAQTQGLSIYSAPQMGFVVCTKLCVSAEALLTEVELVQLSAKPTGEPGPCPRAWLCFTPLPCAYSLGSMAPMVLHVARNLLLEQLSSACPSDARHIPVSTSALSPLIFLVREPQLLSV